MRPPFALSRLSELDDGRIAYRTRYPLRGGATHRIMDPMELMARLAALVAPPRHPLVRYFGTLSSHSAWRPEVVPRPAPATTGANKKRCPKQADAASQNDGEHPTSATPPSTSRDASNTEPDTTSSVTSPSAADHDPSAIAARRVAALAITATTPAGPGARLDLLEPFNVITAQHLERLLDGKLLATGPRLSWTQLLQRTFSIDLSTCPRCGGHIKPIAQIHDPEVIRRILDHLDRKRAPPSPAPRGPPVH